MRSNNLFNSITVKEWKFVFFLTVFLIIITTLPYLYGHFSAAPNQIYNGLHILTPGDIHVYFSYFEQVNQGHYQFQNLFTSEATKSIFNIFWLAVGIIGKILNLNHAATFQLTRILLIPLCIISAYFLISYFFNSKLIRKITLVFLLFSSGVGVLASVFLPAYINNQTLFYWPMDLWVPEYNFFLTLYHSPHLIASLTLIILIFLFFLKAIDKNSKKQSVLAGLCGLLLIQFHPFHLPTIWLIPLIYIIAKYLISNIQYRDKKIFQPAGRHGNFQFLNKFRSHNNQQLTINNQLQPVTISYNKLQLITNLKHFLILVALSSPSALYYLWLTQTDWATNLKAIQNVCYTPRFFVVLISYGGLIAVPAIIALLYLAKKITNYKTCPELAEGLQITNKSKIQNTQSAINNQLQQVTTSYNKLLSITSQNKILFLVTWAAAQFTLIFLPFPFQRRLTEGLQIPLVFLTILGVLWLKDIFKEGIQSIQLDKILFNKYLLAIIFLLGFTLSNWFVIQQDVAHFDENYELFYYDKQQIESYQWLKDNTTTNEIILSSMPNGNFIPGIAARKVYFGHVNVETLYYDEKLANVKWFFKNNSDDNKKIEFLANNNIKYIYYSKYEKKMGNFQPATKDYLKNIYSNNFTTIYKVL